MDDQRRCRWGSVVWLPFGLLLLASLLITETRELQVCTFRLLFRLQGTQTFVLGQPSGCVVTIVPNVNFTESFCQACLAAATDSPDAYLLARYCHPAVKRVPPAAAWQGHPLLEWGAMEIVCQLTTPDPEPDGRPGNVRGIPSKESIDRAAEIVHLAQASRPENGALWMAEAFLHFERGADEAGLSALTTAAQKPEWDSVSSTVFFHTRRLLEEQGMPRVDASTAAHSPFWLGSFLSAGSSNATHLARLIAEAVAQEDHEKMASLLTLWSDLTRGKPPPYQWKRFPPMRWRSDIIQEAVAERLGRELPDSGVEWQQRQALETNLLLEYFTAQVGGELSRELLGDERLPPEVEAAAQFRSREQNAILVGALRSSVGGMLTLLLMAMVFSMFLLEVPFLQLPRDATLAGCRRWFWLVLVLAGVVSAVLLFSAIHAVVQPVGLRVGPSKDPIWDNIAFASLLAVLLLVMRLVLLKRSSLVRIGWVILLLLYFSALGTTAYTRHGLSEAIASWYGG
jgi:hypothetical protein